MATSTTTKKITPAEEAKVEAANAARQSEKVEQLDHSAAESAVAKVEEAAGAEPGKLADAPTPTESQIKNRLRNEAEREILDKYKDELVQITNAKFDAAGIKYVRRLSQDEKDEKALEALLAKNPKLRSKFAAPVEAEATVGE